MLTDLVLPRTRSPGFAGSRRSVEILRRRPKLPDEVEAASHASPLPRRVHPEERREPNANSGNGELLGLASTSALELALTSPTGRRTVAGWPGTRASFMQRVGRAGRSVRTRSQCSLPTTTRSIPTWCTTRGDFRAEVEATVFDPTNPYVLTAAVRRRAGGTHPR